MNALAALASQERQEPLLLPTPEVVVQLLALLVVLGLLARSLLPRINRALTERRAAVEDGISEARSARTEAEQALELNRSLLAEAGHEAARLRQEATDQGFATIAAMREQGARQRDSLVAAGRVQVEADRRASVETLRRELGTVVTDLAGQLAAESLEDQARQSRVIDRFIGGLEDKAAKSR
ncbi:F0F1 ATP synthase subunit B [Streptomyces sp. 4F14]|uniref:F0F1 ATP synthase subunit B family protein n=1 Tax=Streptomyces sp. 4F14 TaxID=3394380 RepID=UPI003A89C786